MVVGVLEEELIEYFNRYVCEEVLRFFFEEILVFRKLVKVR